MFDKKSQLFLILFSLFLTCALVAEIVGAKIFSLETLLGIPPSQLHLGSYSLDFNLTAGVILWPLVFIISDITNEYFGPSGVKKMSFLTAGCISLAFVFIWMSTSLPPADFWMNIYNKDPAGRPLDINHAYKLIFRQGLGIILGSLCAFLLGQVIDALIFQQLKKITHGKYIWLRATGSTMVSQLIDSYVVLAIAFGLFGNWKMDFIVAVGTMNLIYKLTVAVVLTPLLYIAHSYIDSYLEV